MSTRPMLVISCAAIAAIAVVGPFSGSAHALEVGPLVVPVTVPPVNVGPVAVTTDPAIGVRVATSPTQTVAVGVAPPRTLDPRTILSRPGDLVQLAIGSAPPAPASPPSTVGSQPVGAPAPAVGVASPAPSTPSVARPSVPTDSALAPVADATPTVGLAAASRGAPVAVAADPVNASLRRDAPRGAWSLLWDVASASRTLWSALALISLLAIGIIGRMLRDAQRRDGAQVLSPA